MNVLLGNVQWKWQQWMVRSAWPPWNYQMNWFYRFYFDSCLLCQSKYAVMTQIQFQLILGILNISSVWRNWTHQRKDLERKHASIEERSIRMVQIFDFQTQFRCSKNHLQHDNDSFNNKTMWLTTSAFCFPFWDNFSLARYIDVRKLTDIHTNRTNECRRWLKTFKTNNKLKLALANAALCFTLSTETRKKSHQPFVCWCKSQ